MTLSLHGTKGPELPHRHAFHSRSLPSECGFSVLIDTVDIRQSFANEHRPILLVKCRFDINCGSFI